METSPCKEGRVVESKLTERCFHGWKTIVTAFITHVLFVIIRHVRSPPPPKYSEWCVIQRVDMSHTQLQGRETDWHSFYSIYIQGFSENIWNCLWMFFYYLTSQTCSCRALGLFHLQLLTSRHPGHVRLSNESMQADHRPIYKEVLSTGWTAIHLNQLCE